MKFLKDIAKEKRRIRWSSGEKATKVFFSTLLTIAILVIAISLFSSLVLVILPN